MEGGAEVGAVERHDADAARDVLQRGGFARHDQELGAETLDGEAVRDIPLDTLFALFEAAAKVNGMGAYGPKASTATPASPTA